MTEKEKIIKQSCEAELEALKETVSRIEFASQSPSFSYSDWLPRLTKANDALAPAKNKPYSARR